MKEKHIIEIIESKSFANLSESERVSMQAHTATCISCSRAYNAALISASLINQRAAETFEPSPFFPTRVLAALRERQNEVPAFKRLWQSAGALVSTMTATVALLAVLSFMVPSSNTLTGAQASASNGYSAEEVLLHENDLAEEQASDAQVLSSLYAAEEESAR